MSDKELDESYGTILLPIAESKAVAGDRTETVRLLFGSWVESGNEDEQLKELYELRGQSSSSNGVKENKEG